MKRVFATFSGLVLLAGCESGPPKLPAVTTFAPTSTCSNTPSIATAVSMTPEKPSARLEVILPVSAKSACMQTAAGASTPYAVFALPTTGRVASVSAGAVMEFERVLAPAVFTLDAGNRVVRTFGEKDLQHRGRTVAVLFVPKAEEKFVVVAADAGKVGGAYSLVSVDPVSAGSPPALKKPEEIAAYRQEMVKPYSFEGQVFARAYFADPDQAAP